MAAEPPIPEQKRELRRRMREALARLDPQVREGESEKLRQRLATDPHFASHRRLMGRISCRCCARWRTRDVRFSSPAGT
jgi:hypothetical protein